MPTPPETRNLTGYVLSFLLLIAIAAAVVLMALQLRGDAPVRFEVSEAQGIECPPGEGVPACFTFDVTNTGDRPARAECTVSASGGQHATFLNDAVTFTSIQPLEPGVAQELPVKVDAGDEGAATEPTVTCRSV
jgi:hypothetical protein